jgi:hypothetical protein
LFERKSSLPESDYSESGTAAGAAYRGCPDVSLTRTPSGLSCHDQQEAELRQTERDKFGGEIETITVTVEGMVGQVAGLLEENTRLPEKDRWGIANFTQLA